MALGFQRVRAYADRAGQCEEEAMGTLPESVRDSANGGAGSARPPGSLSRCVARSVRRYAALWLVPVLVVGTVAFSSGGHSVPASAASESSNGYWLVASDGGIFTYGDANFHGSAGACLLYTSDAADE